MRMLRSPRIGALALGILSLQPGCVGAPELDLSSIFASAEIWVETERIDLGTAPARHHLIDGWGSGDERWAGREDETFVWGLGAASELEFFVVSLESRAMTVTGRPYRPDGTAVLTTMRVLVNGVPLPVVDVEPGWQTYQVPIPTRILRRGSNRVRFEYPAGGDDTSLKFAFDELAFTNATVTALPRLGMDRGGSIALPYLSGVEFDLEVEPGALLVIEELRPYGRPLAAAPTLRVRIDIDGEQQVHDIETPQSRFLRPEPIPISRLEPGPARITLMVIPPDEFYGLRGHQAEQDVGIEIIRPRVRGTARPLPRQP
jgi:hypothetical protein